MGRLRASRLSSLRSLIALRKNEIKTDRRVSKRTLSFLTKQRDDLDVLHEHWDKKYNAEYGTRVCVGVCVCVCVCVCMCVLSLR